MFFTYILGRVVSFPLAVWYLCGFLYLRIVFHLARCGGVEWGGSQCALVYLLRLCYLCVGFLFLGVFCGLRICFFAPFSLEKGFCDAKTTKKHGFLKKKVENVLWLKKKPYICTRFTTVTALQMMTASLAQLARARDL